MSKRASKTCPHPRVLWQWKRDHGGRIPTDEMGRHIQNCARCRGILDKTPNVVILRPNDVEENSEDEVKRETTSKGLTWGMVVLALVMFTFGMITFAFGDRVFETLKLRSDLSQYLRYTYSIRVPPQSALSFGGQSLRLSFPEPWFDSQARWPEAEGGSSVASAEVRERLSYALSERIDHDVDANLLHGYAYLLVAERSARQFEEAKAVMALANNQAAGQPDILNDLGILTISMGQVEQGVDYLDQALIVDRNHIPAMHNRIVMAGLRGELTKEAELLQRYLGTELGGQWSAPMHRRFEELERQNGPHSGMKQAP